MNDKKIEQKIAARCNQLIITSLNNDVNEDMDEFRMLSLIRINMNKLLQEICKHEKYDFKDNSLICVGCGKHYDRI